MIQLGPRGDSGHTFAEALRIHAALRDARRFFGYGTDPPNPFWSDTVTCRARHVYQDILFFSLLSLAETMA